ncbi:MAG: insulinase family protein [Halanaerobiales bacterium]|nr:insulinase family protein [Halanaerobiales bacterium]
MIFKNYDKIEERYFQKELKAGLKVILIPRDKFNKKHAILSVNAGSVDLKLKDSKGGMINYPIGIAHFMEHILFENREGSIIDHFSRIGSSVNAYTGFNNTNYYFNTTNNFLQSLKYLLGFILKPNFDQQRIEHEKNVIKQEIKMYKDSPGWQSFYQLLQSLYFEYPIKYNIAGTAESIESLDKEILEDFYQKYYRIDNMTLIMIGDIKHDPVLNYLSNTFSVGKKKRDYKKVYPVEPDQIQSAQKELQMSISRPIISIGYKERSNYSQKSEIIKQDIVTNMLLEMIFGKSNDNYHNLYNSELIDENFSFNYMREKNTGFAKIYAETVHIDKTINALIEVLNKFDKDVNLHNFKIVKNKYIGRFYRSLNSIETLSSQIIKYNNLEQNYFNLINTIESIKLDDLIKQHSLIFNNRRPVKIIINNIKDKLRKTPCNAK